MRTEKYVFDSAAEICKFGVFLSQGDVSLIPLVLSCAKGSSLCCVQT